MTGPLQDICTTQAINGHAGVAFAQYVFTSKGL